MKKFHFTFSKILDLRLKAYEHQASVLLRLRHKQEEIQKDRINCLKDYEAFLQASSKDWHYKRLQPAFEARKQQTLKRLDAALEENRLAIQAQSQVLLKEKQAKDALYNLQERHKTLYKKSFLKAVDKDHDELAQLYWRPV